MTGQWMANELESHAWNSQARWDTKEEAKAHGRNALGIVPEQRFFVGRVEEIGIPSVDLDSILESLEENVLDEAGSPDGADPWPELSEAEKQSLQEKLDKVLQEALPAPKVYCVVDVEEVPGEGTT